MSKNYIQIKKLMFTQPEVWARALLPLQLSACAGALTGSAGISAIGGMLMPGV